VRGLLFFPSHISQILRHFSIIYFDHSHRKEKALAEAATLLILKKKAHQIWGDVEDN
jgi:hypothetical protein